MKLIELNPRWVSGDTERNRCGITFDCPGPCCAGKADKDRLYVPFRNPVDGGEAMTGEPRWNRSGDTFETLTLTPSVDASKWGHWHGFVTNGQTT